MTADTTAPSSQPSPPPPPPRRRKPANASAAAKASSSSSSQSTPLSVRLYRFLAALIALELTMGTFAALRMRRVGGGGVESGDGDDGGGGGGGAMGSMLRSFAGGESAASGRREGGGGSGGGGAPRDRIRRGVASPTRRPAPIADADADEGGSEASEEAKAEVATPQAPEGPQRPLAPLPKAPLHPPVVVADDPLGAPPYEDYVGGGFPGFDGPVRHFEWERGRGCRRHPETGARLCHFGPPHPSPGGREGEKKGGSYGLALDASAFIVSEGGEDPAHVLGRPEEDELFQIEPGWIALRLPREVQFYSRWYDGKLMQSSSVGLPPESQCDVRLEGLTILYERVEYANLFHTFVDWFNVHWSLEQLEREGKFREGTDRLRFIFLDGHARSNIDSVWGEIYNAETHYVSEYRHRGKGMVCMERAMFLPKDSPVYEIPRPPRCDDCDIFRRYLRRIMKAYGASHRGGPTEDVIIDRSRYLAHPRVKMDGRPADRFAAEREIDDLHRLFPNATVVRLHEMTFGEQVRLMARTRRLRGMHGAGLTHLLFLPPGAEAVEWYGEITGGMYVFELLATWRPDVRGEGR